MRLAYLAALIVLSTIGYLLELALSTVKKLITAIERDFR